MTRRWMTRAIALLAVTFAGLQVVPYGRDHSNPPRASEPVWDSPATRALARRACFDCHSNETVWPAYANVAPASWLVQHDVDEGRAVLNFSEWQRPQEEAAEAGEALAEGEMPPAMYVLMHAQARLTETERAQLMRGLERTIGSTPVIGHED